MKKIYGEELRLDRTSGGLLTVLAVFYVGTIFLFALIYRLLFLYDAGSFAFSERPDFNNFIAPIYYSVTTITSTGYGDIDPKTELAMLAAMAQMLIGYFFTVIFFSVLAGLAFRGSRHRD